jgi:site-specific recombinase XerD
MVRATSFFKHVEEYCRYREEIYNTSPQTLKSNRADLSLFKSFINQSGRKVINGPAVMRFQYHLKKDRDNCGGSINRKLFTLRSYGHFLSIKDIPGADRLPFYNVLKIRQGYRNRPDALTGLQIRRLFEVIRRDTVQGIRDYAAYALMYQIGLRVGEVYLLDLSDLDLETRQIRVTGKGNKYRELHLTDELAQCVSEWIAVRPFVMGADKSEALFVSKKGNRLSIRTLEDNFKKILDRATLKARFNVTCHSLRHSFASHLNEKDVDILVIQSLMGHATTRSTEPYIHASLEKVRAAIEKLPAVLFMNELIASGVVKLKFQRNRPKRE